jgi:hypothetical protein
MSADILYLPNSEKVVLRFEFLLYISSSLFTFVNFCFMHFETLLFRHISLCLLC